MEYAFEFIDYVYNIKYKYKCIGLQATFRIASVFIIIKRTRILSYIQFDFSSNT